MQEIRLGTIGSGTIVHSFLDNVAITPCIHLEAVYSRSLEKGTALARKYGATKVYTDLDALLSDSAINFVYIATPNLLHYEQAKKALLAGVNVILEKPFTANVTQAKELIQLARNRRLFLIDAVPTAFLPNLDILKKHLADIGNIKLVISNYSQYSSRYDQVLDGESPNIFNPQYAGGCLMDINFYNVYLNIALFGAPIESIYYPNIYPGLADTSGSIILRYDGFVSQNAGAKDTWGVNFFQIEGEKGYIYIAGGANGIKSVRIVTKESDVTYNSQQNPDRWYYEVLQIVTSVVSDDYERLNNHHQITLSVIESIETARKAAGILFPCDF